MTLNNKINKFPTFLTDEFNEMMELPQVQGDGHPFQVFFSKQEANEYLLKRGIITREEFFLRENPELRTGRFISDEEASIPF